MGREPESIVSLPVPIDELEDRATPNRIDLADVVPGTQLTEDFDGHLDVVMHGDATGTEAALGDDRVPFELDEVAAFIEQLNPDGNDRPVRMMSCSVGQANYAQDLAERLGVTVYAPADKLAVADDGGAFVLNGGRWERFEPS